MIPSDFFRVVKSNNVSRAKKAIKKTPSLVNDRRSMQEDPLGYTPLMHAAGEGHFGMAYLLIEKGANIEAKEYNGNYNAEQIVDEKLREEIADQNQSQNPDFTNAWKFYQTYKTITEERYNPTSSFYSPFSSRYGYGAIFLGAIALPALGMVYPAIRQPIITYARNLLEKGMIAPLLDESVRNTVVNTSYYFLASTTGATVLYKAKQSLCTSFLRNTKPESSYADMACANFPSIPLTHSPN